MTLKELGFRISIRVDKFVDYNTFHIRIEGGEVLYGENWIPAISRGPTLEIAGWSLVCMVRNRSLRMMNDVREWCVPDNVVFRENEYE